MSFELSVSGASRLAEVTAWGRFDFAESLAAAEALEADPGFEASFRVLVDLREIDFKPPTQEVEGFALTLPRFRSCCRGRVAIVTGSDLHFGLARTLCTISEAHGFSMRPFADYGVARSWLLEARSQGG